MFKLDMPNLVKPFCLCTIVYPRLATRLSNMSVNYAPKIADVSPRCQRCSLSAAATLIGTCICSDKVFCTATCLGWLDAKNIRFLVDKPINNSLARYYRQPRFVCVWLFAFLPECPIWILKLFSAPCGLAPRLSGGVDDLSVTSRISRRWSAICLL